jgi:hypothetical protein
VIAQAAGSASVSFLVTVQGAGAASCSTNAQCGPGQICGGDPPTCEDARGCGDTRPCPAGTVCVDEFCEPPGDAACDPGTPLCAAGQCCDPVAWVCRDPCAMTCASGTHCEPGPACGAGSCVPDETMPDLTGLWLTRHDFDLRQTLPMGVRDVFKGIRLMDQTLFGKLTIAGLPRWLQEILNTFISRLLQQYLPEWTQQIIHLSDDLFTVLSNLRSEGAMRLTRHGDVAHLTGKEVWTSLVFYWLPLCNGEIDGDPAVPPECARIDVVTTDSDRADETAQCKGELLPSIRVQVSPFTGTVVKRDGVYALDVDRRQVTLEMGKVLLILIDQMLALVTAGEYHCIQEATFCARGTGCFLDCEGLGRDVENATDGIVDSGTVEELCSHAVRASGEVVVDALANAWPLTADTLDFSGSALISGQADDSVCHRGSLPGACAAQLAAGEWSGDLFFRLLRRQPGAWEAARPE